MKMSVAKKATTYSNRSNDYLGIEGIDLSDNAEPPSRPSRGRQKISPDTFRGLITARVNEICSERGWKYDNNAHRGWAFQFWVADLFCRREGIEASPEESVFLNNDCGIDI